MNQWEPETLPTFYDINLYTYNFECTELMHGKTFVKNFIEHYCK